MSAPVYRALDLDVVVGGERFRLEDARFGRPVLYREPPRGSATLDVLRRRASYGGRKGRRAWDRLRALEREGRREDRLMELERAREAHGYEMEITLSVKRSAGLDALLGRRAP